MISLFVCLNLLENAGLHVREIIGRNLDLPQGHLGEIYLSFVHRP